MKSPLTHFIFVAVLSGLIFFGYASWYLSVSAKSAEVADLENQITVITNTMKNAAATRAALAEISGDESVVQDYFVADTEVVSFINDLQARGLAQGATVNVLSVSTTGSSTRPTLLTALTVNGTFNSVMRTIGAIEYAPYDIFIASVSVGQDEKDSWHANMSLVVGSISKDVATSTPDTSTTASAGVSANTATSTAGAGSPVIPISATTTLP